MNKHSPDYYDFLEKRDNSFKYKFIRLLHKIGYGIKNCTKK